MLLQIFAGASLILGLYLTLLFFSSSSNIPIITPAREYHLGCYDSSNSHTHSLDLQQKLSGIQKKLRQSIHLNMHLSKTSRPNFDQNVGQIAKSFELYLDHFYKLKGHNDQDRQYYNSLHLAKREFQNCKTAIHINQTDCVEAWKDYQRSLKEIDSLKDRITQLVNVKQKTQQSLSAILLKKPVVSDDEIERNFVVKIKELRQKIDVGDESIIQLRARKNHIKVDFSSVDSELQQLKELLNECVTNQQLIIYCNKITKDVKRIEQIAPKMAKKKLELRLAKKQTIISGLEENIKKFKRLGDNREALNQENQLGHQRNELKLLEYQIQNFQTQEESRCAMCSEERIRELRKNITDLQNKKKQSNTNLISIESEITKTDLEMSKLKTETQTLQKDRETAITTQFCLDDQCKLNQKNTLLEKQNSLNELKKQIIDTQVQVNFLTSKISSKLNGVKNFLKPVDSIVDCLLKKKYYDELKKHKPQENRIDEKMSKVKETIINKLSDFEL